jgi:hypothetical protein
MGTRGVYGYRVDGVLKVTYNGSDSYPNGWGMNHVRYIGKYTIDQMREVAKRIKLVEKLDKIQYDKLLKYQGGFASYHEGMDVMIDSSGFLNDAVSCEWSYIINLDSEKLEIYHTGDFMIKEVSLLRIQQRIPTYLKMMESNLTRYYSKKNARIRYTSSWCIFCMKEIDDYIRGKGVVLSVEEILEKALKNDLTSIYMGSNQDAVVTEVKRQLQVILAMGKDKRVCQMLGQKGDES